MPLLLIPLVMVGIVLLLVVPIMLVYMLVKFLAFPIIILLIVWFCRWLSPRSRNRGSQMNNSRFQRFTSGNRPRPRTPRERRKDVTKDAEEHDVNSKKHDDSQRWDDF